MQKVIGFSLALILVSVVAIHSEEMVLIPAGEFQMGNDVYENASVHTVYLDAFYIDKYEVTNAQYKEFVDANPEWSKTNIDLKFRNVHMGGYLNLWERNTYPSGKDDHPVEGISWYAAMAYAKWKGKRLPTEAEWEKAARGGLEGQEYPWGNSIDSTKTNYMDLTVPNYAEKVSTAVGTYPHNGYGLYDMVGNVKEWCLDKYLPSFYEVSPRRNPVAGVGEISHLINNFTYVDPYAERVIRGGYYRVAARSVAARGWDSPFRGQGAGFRCVRDVMPGEDVQPSKDISIPKSETGTQKTTKNRDTDTEKMVEKQKVVKPQQQSARDRAAEVQRKNSTEGMVLIPAGKFRMGTDQLVGNESKPIHTVYLDAFYIDTHEVTVGEYKEFLQESGYPVSLHSELSEFSSTDDHPIVGVTWHDAMAYAQWAGKRLPTEAEWEKAARDGLIDMKYPWGNDEIDSAKANYGKLHSGAVPVGSYPPSNAFGLYDMAGNVAEWCLDPWNSNFYANSPTENPFAGHKSRDETIIDYKSIRGLRVVRGGSWAQNTSPSFWVSGRFKQDAMKKLMNVGFRCAKDAP